MMIKVPKNHKTEKKKHRILGKNYHSQVMTELGAPTVDGGNPAPPGMYKTL